MLVQIHLVFNVLNNENARLLKYVTASNPINSALFVTYRLIRKWNECNVLRTYLVNKDKWTLAKINEWVKDLDNEVEIESIK